MMDPTKVRKHRLIRALPFRRMMQYLKSQEILTETGSGLLHETTGSGTKLWMEDDGVFPIRITARDGLKYAWNGLKAEPGGVWVDLSRPSGTISPDKDWAEELNGIEADTPQVVLAWREPQTLRVIFQRELC